MRLIIFIAVIVGIAAIFGIVYGINALLQRKRGNGSNAGRHSTARVTKTVAPDDDPEFLRNLARKLAEEEAKNKRDNEGEQENDK